MTYNKKEAQHLHYMIQITDIHILTFGHFSSIRISSTRYSIHSDRLSNDCQYEINLYIAIGKCMQSFMNANQQIQIPNNLKFKFDKNESEL